MISTIQIVANCDTCQLSRTFNSVPREQVAEQLAELGWQVVPKQPGEAWPCKCPACKK